MSEEEVAPELSSEGLEDITKSGFKVEVKKKEADIPPPKVLEGAFIAEPYTRGRVYESVLDTIGATPLVKLPRMTEKYALEATVLLKLEFFNPLASVKDRIGFAMIEAAERNGQITPGKTIIVEPTSGNTGIALAFICANKGYKLILTMPESMSIERRKMLRYFGAEIILTPAEQGMSGAIKRAKEILLSSQDAFIPSQFMNPNNPKIHEETTAHEIWTDTNGAVDVLVAGVGTGGTISGVSRALKKHKPELRSYAVEPKDSPVISGGEPGPHKIQGIGAGFIPDNYDETVVDSVIQVSNQQAFATAQEVAKLEGIPGGISTGANVAAAMEAARMPENKGKTIVTFACSFAERYISTDLFEDINSLDK